MGSVFNPATLVTSVNIFYRNEQLQGIGLPSVEAGLSFQSLFEPEALLKTTSQFMSLDDSGLSEVTLVVTTDYSDIQPYNFFFILFTFSDSSPINTLDLSEIEICIEGRI